jgi:hypothetical protein
MIEATVVIESRQDFGRLTNENPIARFQSKGTWNSHPGFAHEENPLYARTTR